MTSQPAARQTYLKLTGAEIQSGHSRQRFAEGLIAQLPKNHDGRNTWLMNFGTGDEAVALRKARDLYFDPEFDAVAPGHMHVAGTTVGKDIDTCAKCGRDLRHEIHRTVRA